MKVLKVNNDLFYTKLLLQSWYLLTNIDQTFDFPDVNNNTNKFITDTCRYDTIIKKLLYF